MKAILERDFFQFAKRKRYYSMRTLAVALPLGILLLAMSVADLRDDQLGEFVFATTAWPVVCFAALLSPGMTAGLLVEERRDNRLDVLRSTPMAAWQIVVGRWFSRVALLWTMILAALPLCASSLLFSGVSPGQFLDVAVIALLTVPLFSSLALLVSSGGGDLGAVQRTANSLTIALLILPILGLGGFLRGSRDVIRDIVLCVAALDPLVVLVSTIDGRSNANWPAPPLVLFVAMGAAVTFACVALSVR
ncbi:MAG: ABC transporter permease, partial [Gammaproteobacteria bacterium]|nr:ABC transporter permease [Gammaproteobacteria bacterium]